MQLIKSIIRPHKVEAVQDALAQVGVSGITVTEVRGHGRQHGRPTVYRGQEYQVNLLPKISVECIVPDHLTQSAVKAVIDAARTGEVGDGRVFVTPIFESYRIRTGEIE